MASTSFASDAVLSDRYQIIREVGRGGMGVVYEGFHLRLRQRIAIKALVSEGEVSHEDYARFQREAWAAARMGSEHAVRILDVDRAPDGTPFLVMEFVDGKTLAQVLDERPMPLAELIGHLSEVAEALDEAHAAGIVHRDIKLENILLTETTRGPIAKLADFGIAKLLDSPIAITNPAAVVGTPKYMSPEQIRGAAVDHRSDVFSLAVCFYRAVTGTFPFREGDGYRYLASVLADPPYSLLRFVPSLPEELDAVLCTAFEKNPADRFASASALVDALAPWCAAQDGTREAPANRFRSAPPLTPEESTDTGVDPRAIAQPDTVFATRWSTRRNRYALFTLVLMGVAFVSALAIGLSRRGDGGAVRGAPESAITAETRGNVPTTTGASTNPPKELPSADVVPSGAVSGGVTGEARPAVSGSLTGGSLRPPRGRPDSNAPGSATQGSPARGPAKPASTTPWGELL